MHRPIWSVAVTASLLLLSACGGSSTEDGKLAETRMDDLESLKGTISDDMIITDQSTDEAPVEAAPTVVPAKKSAQPESEPAQTEEAELSDIRVEPEPATE